MSSSGSDSEVALSSGSDSDDTQPGHDGWDDRGHEASLMAMNGQHATFEDALAAALDNAESVEAKRRSQGSAFTAAAFPAAAAVAGSI